MTQGMKLYETVWLKWFVKKGCVLKAIVSIQHCLLFFYFFFLNSTFWESSSFWQRCNGCFICKVNIFLHMRLGRSSFMQILHANIIHFFGFSCPIDYCYKIMLGLGLRHYCKFAILLGKEWIGDLHWGGSSLIENVISQLHWILSSLHSKWRTQASSFHLWFPSNWLEDFDA